MPNQPHSSRPSLKNCTLVIRQLRNFVTRLSLAQRQQRKVYTSSGERAAMPKQIPLLGSANLLMPCAYSMATNVRLVRCARWHREVHLCSDSDR